MVPQICIALDGMSLLHAIEMAERLTDRVWGFKVGDLVTEYGLSAIIDNLRDKGKVSLISSFSTSPVPSTIIANDW